MCVVKNCLNPSRGDFCDTHRQQAPADLLAEADLWAERNPGGHRHQWALQAVGRAFQ